MKYTLTIICLFFSYNVCAIDIVTADVAPQKTADEKIDVAAQKIIDEKTIADYKALQERKEKSAKQDRIEATADALSKWNLGFGIGVEQYRTDYIDSASLRGDSRVVTLEQQYETRPSAWLTMNWPINKSQWGVFMGVKVIDANSEAFSSFALGPQYTFLTDKLQKISVGLGWVTHSTKTFAKGISEGQPLPERYDDIVYEKGTENSYMLMLSVGI